MKRKKTFPCGHSGYGSFCHACKAAEDAVAAKQAAVAARAAVKQSLRDAFAADAVDLRELPTPQLVERARQILQAIATGEDYRQFKGKRMNYDRAVVSVPVGYHYRLLFAENPDGRLKPLELMSHEAYNATKPG